MTSSKNNDQTDWFISGQKDYKGSFWLREGKNKW